MSALGLLTNENHLIVQYVRNPANAITLGNHVSEEETEEVMDSWLAFLDHEPTIRPCSGLNIPYFANVCRLGIWDQGTATPETQSSQFIQPQLDEISPAKPGQQVGVHGSRMHKCLP